MRKKQIYSIKFLRSKGYPYKIKGNDGYVAVLCDIQPLLDGDYEAVYRYPGGDAVHDMDRMKAGRVIVDKIYYRYLKGRLLGRPTWGAEPRWCRGFTYRKKFSV